MSITRNIFVSVHREPDNWFTVRARSLLSTWVYKGEGRDKAVYDYDRAMEVAAKIRKGISAGRTPQDKYWRKLDEQSHKHTGAAPQGHQG